MLTCKGLDPSVFFVGWFCGFDDAPDIGTLCCKSSSESDALSKIVHVQQLARDLGLERRRVLVVLNGDAFHQDYTDVFLHGKETHDIFPVLVQRHTNRVFNAEMIAVDKCSFPFSPEDSAATAVYDDQDVLVCVFQDAKKKVTIY